MVNVTYVDFVFLSPSTKTIIKTQVFLEKIIIFMQIQYFYFEFENFY